MIMVNYQSVKLVEYFPFPQKQNKKKTAKKICGKIKNLFNKNTHYIMQPLYRCRHYYRIILQK